MAAGVCAGLFSKSILQPLDLVKTRLQVQRSHALHDPRLPYYTGIRDAFSKIVRHEGVTALYTGLGPNLLGSGISWGSYFFLYNVAKSAFLSLEQQQDNRPHTDVRLSAPHHFLSAAFAGVGTVFITNPIWMIKTRLQLQFKSAQSPHGRISLKPVV